MNKQVQQTFLNVLISVKVNFFFFRIKRKFVENFFKTLRYQLNLISTLGQPSDFRDFHQAAVFVVFFVVFF